MDKTCSTCGETKPETEFWRKASGSKGLQGSCKVCTDIAHRAGRLRPAQSSAPEGMKRCSTCGETKQVTEFTRNKRYFDGLHIVCKPCHYRRHKTYRQTPDGRATINKGQHKRQGQPTTKAAHYDQKMRKKFSLPIVWTYDAMLRSQDGKCAICGSDHNVGKFRFALDHDPATGRIRGLLCTWCNQAIGQLRESPELLRKAANYLENPPATQFLASVRCGG